MREMTGQLFSYCCDRHQPTSPNFLFGTDHRSPPRPRLPSAHFPDQL